MARNGSGTSAHTTSSATRASASIEACGATGTASTTRAAPCARATWHAARAVEPVAIPSSTTIALLPVSGSRGRPAR